MWIDPNLLYGVSGGLIAYVLGRSRRGAFICGVVGVMLADVVNALVLWSQGIQQRLTLGGAGLVDSVVISGILAVLLAEAVGEILERIQRGKSRTHIPPPGRSEHNEKNMGSGVAGTGVPDVYGCIVRGGTRMAAFYAGGYLSDSCGRGAGNRGYIHRRR